MSNLLQAEIYKIIHRKPLGICLLFPVIIEFVNGFLHGGDQPGTMTLLMEIIGLISCSLFAGLFIGADFSSRTMIHTVTAGKNRVLIWISRYLSFLITSFVILLANMLAAYASFLSFHGIDVAFTAIECIAVIIYTAAGIFYDLCLVSFFFFITMLVKESGISIAVSVVISGILIANSNVFWVDRLFPLINAQAIMSSIPVRNLLIVVLISLGLMLSGSLLFQKRDILL